MTAPEKPHPTPPAAGLFGACTAADRPALPLGNRDAPTQRQRSSFPGLFRADGEELSAA